MTETQDTVHKWINETFPGTDPNSPRKSIRALEEMIELCLASGATPNDIEASMLSVLANCDRDDDEGIFEPERIPAEAADVLIVLYGLSGMRGFDLHQQVNHKMEINRARKWKAKGDGTGYHIKNAENT